MGELSALGAAVIWAISLSIFTKHSKDVSPFGINILRGIVSLICLSIVILILKPRWPENVSIWVELALSGFFGLAISDITLYAALKRLGAQLTTASQTLSPPMTVIMAFLFLNESLSFFEIFGMTLTLLSILGIVFLTPKSKNENFSWSLKGAEKDYVTGLLYALLAAFFNAIGIVLSRDALKDLDPFLGSAMRMAPAFVAVLIFLYVAPKLYPKLALVLKKESLIPKDRKKIMWISLAAFLGAFIGVTLMTIGIKYARAGIASSLSVTYPIWIVPMAYFFLKEPVRKTSLILTLVAVAGVVLLMTGKV